MSAAQLVFCPLSSEKGPSTHILFSRHSVDTWESGACRDWGQVRMKSLKPSDPNQVGEIRLSGRLGQGGMGTVYFGVTPDGDRVAVKMIRDELTGKSGVRARFDREIDILGMVQGPRVAGLVAAAEPDEVPQWFATEYVQGLTLAEYVRERGTFGQGHAAVLGILLAEGLKEIHDAGLLHRDLKPANVILGSDGPRVIDFGLAAFADRPGDITQTSDAIGTPVCMAPEQATNAGNLTAKVDVHALGAVLVFAMTGHFPYEGPTTPAIWHVLTDPATEPNLSGVPENMKPLVTQALAHNPDDRPTVTQVADELKAVARGVTLEEFIARTYIERDTDPTPAAQEPPKPPRLRMPRQPRVPNDLVLQVAEYLRHDYARGAAL
jgi:eukaryotic-like serine/threonine-protein kinase